MNDVVLVLAVLPLVVAVVHGRIEDSDWAARRRWRRINARTDRECRCDCGSPGTVRVTSPWSVQGGVQPVWWRCDEHANVPGNKSVRIRRLP